MTPADHRTGAPPAGCPRCGAALTGAVTCPACALPLTGPVAAQLWAVDVEIAGLQGQVAELGAQRQRLLTELVALGGQSSGQPPTPVPPPQLPVAPQVARPRTSAPSGWSAPFAPPPLSPGRLGAPLPRPSQEWTPRRIQNALLTLGALLLAVAGVVFVAVSWGRLGVAGRGAILAG